MIKQGVRKEVATLSVSCRKGHNINMAIDMKHSADLRFVDGELRILSLSLARSAVVFFSIEALRADVVSRLRSEGFLFSS